MTDHINTTIRLLEHRYELESLGNKLKGKGIFFKETMNRLQAGKTETEILTEYQTSNHERNRTH